jgi:hypothetical protein
MAASTALSLLCAGMVLAGPGTSVRAGPEPDARERKQFALFTAGTATGVVGLGAAVIGFIGLDRSRYAACEVSDDPTEPVVTPRVRCFDETVFARRHRNANVMMVTGLAAGGALLLTSAALITSGLVIRRRRLRSAHGATLSWAPTLGGNWGVAASLRF